MLGKRLERAVGAAAEHAAVGLEGQHRALHCADSRDSSLCHEPTEKSDIADPMLPTHPKQPTLPIDSTEPVDRIERTEPVDPIDRIDRVDRRERHERPAVVAHGAGGWSRTNTSPLEGGRSSRLSYACTGRARDARVRRVRPA